ncbi:MAG: tetratricopeptide repeat protein [Gammaproteobacteria bacterium]|nr:tetratricopeptide repeat protein [Gammaproteobacteria bacterium]
MNFLPPDQLIQSAKRCHQLGQLEEALGLYQQVLELEPGHPQALYLSGVLHCQAGRFEDAIGPLERAAALRGDEPRLHHDLGRAYGGAGRLVEAAAAFGRALALRPDYAEAHLNLGLVRLGEDRPEDAAACFRAAIAVKPDLVLAHYNLGLVLIRQDRLEEAAACYRQALSYKPDFAEAHHNLGLVLSRQDRLDEAVDAYRRALALDPRLVSARYNLALALYNLGRLGESESCYRQTLAQAPDHVEARLDLSLLLGDLGRVDEAVALAREAVALAPDHAKAHLNLGNALLRQGRVEETAACCRRALALDPNLTDAHGAWLMVMQYSEDATAAGLYAAHRRFGEALEASLVSSRRPHANDRDPERRLRLGYVSADFCVHSVAYFFEGILAAHDRARFSVACYYNHNQQDAMSERLRALADDWVCCRGMTDEQLAGRIRADGIDILIDLSGHTRGNRLPVFARKPAPVQVTYLGYPGSTGLESMDYRLCTEETDPPGAEAWHSERLHRLPRGLWCYRPPAGVSEDADSAAESRNTELTFGSMNMIAKLSPRTLSLWAAILRALPSARLAMTSVPEGETRARLRARFAAEGVAPERLELHGKLPYAEYRELLRRVDIALDPYPYNGTTTTCDTLWRGIPVVSLRGETSASRSGYALLKAVGLEDLAAEDEEGYVRVAVALARDGARRAALRTGLRARMEASALRDEAGFTRALEAAYRTLWREWCGA